MTNLSAEARAVEEGHRAFVQPDGSIRVVSDTVEGKAYRVDVGHARPGEPIRFQCEAIGRWPHGTDHGRATADQGCLPCKHAALAARRLEREGLARVTVPGDSFQGMHLSPGTWVAVAPVGPPPRPVVLPERTDPFEGLT